MVRKTARQSWRRQAAQRYQAWLELLDLSERLALAGMKAQGLSEAEAWQTWCRRWARSAKEHQRINRKVARLLHARDKAVKPRSR
ncbi:MAG: hypothetical protein HYZ93_03185 [Candidatus Omnitrophica bacterium]|nr:hypothetical protein [Candidatus Omnitrophota bacterium]